MFRMVDWRPAVKKYLDFEILAHSTHVIITVWPKCIARTDFGELTTS